jgi:superfamily II DNA or RNA helicase
VSDYLPVTITLRPHQQRATDAMLVHDKGQIIVPTGGGKTLTMIMDTKKRHEVINNGTTTVVVAPRILLAEQLCSEFMEVIDPHNSDPYLHVLHCHSGETKYMSTTKAKEIHLYASCARECGENVIIFTTYNSLHRVMEADIEVNTIYFDEAHNSVKRNFFPATEFFANDADRCYFYTATRKTSVTINKPGMNDVDVYGDIICRVSAPELVDGGYIIPPRIQAKQFFIHKKAGMISCETDAENIIDTIEETDTKKILVCVKTSRQLINLMKATDFADELHDLGYSYLYITSKTGAVVDGKKVNREQFFETLNKWGRDPDKKFVVLHRSILSEGINVSELETVIFLRNMDVIEMTQTIGRVLRTGNKSKSFGLCVVPVYSQVGIATERALQTVVNTVFEKGEMLDSVVRR